MTKIVEIPAIFSQTKEGERKELNQGKLLVARRSKRVSTLSGGGILTLSRDVYGKGGLKEGNGRAGSLGEELRDGCYSPEDGGGGNSNGEEGWQRKVPKRFLYARKKAEEGGGSALPKNTCSGIRVQEKQGEGDEAPF